MGPYFSYPIRRLCRQDKRSPLPQHRVHPLYNVAECPHNRSTDSHGLTARYLLHAKRETRPFAPVLAEIEPSNAL